MIDATPGVAEATLLATGGAGGLVSRVIFLCMCVCVCVLCVCMRERERGRERGSIKHTIMFCREIETAIDR